MPARTATCSHSEVLHRGAACQVAGAPGMMIDVATRLLVGCELNTGSVSADCMQMVPELRVWQLELPKDCMEVGHTCVHAAGVALGGTLAGGSL